jgi:transposase-like protein
MMNTSTAPAISKTEVESKAPRRRFTREYKISILERADACTNPGEIGKLLRQEGLYSSHLCSWRGQRRKGILNALSRKRGAKAKSSTQLENEKLRRENERLRKKLAHAEKIIDVQKKLSEVLGIPLDGETDATDSD